MVDTLAANRQSAADATARLRDVIKAIHSAPDPVRDMAALDPALAQASEGWRDVRRLLVSPFVREGKFAPAIAALEKLVAAYPSRIDDRRTLASLLGRTEQWDRAITEADAAADIEPNAVAVHAARIQLRVQAGRLADAAAVARATLGMAQNEPGEAYFWMLAFVRNGDVAEAAGIAAALDPGALPNERVATMAVRALMEDGRTQAAIQFGSAALSAGHDCAALRSSLGLAHLRRGTEE
ncbi:MAG: Vi polysaccharide transport protein VexE, partial [Achromobacter pestifer]